MEEEVKLIKLSIQEIFQIRQCLCKILMPGHLLLME